MIEAHLSSQAVFRKVPDHYLAEQFVKEAIVKMSNAIEEGKDPFNELFTYQYVTSLKNEATAADFFTSISNENTLIYIQDMLNHEEGLEHVKRALKKRMNHEG